MLKSCSKDHWKDAENFIERLGIIGRGFGWGWQSPATPTAELVAEWQGGRPSVHGCPPHRAHPATLFSHGQIFFCSNKIWDEPWRSLVTGGMEVGVQRSQNPQYYGVWRTVVGQKCPVREVQWAGGVHPQGVRGLQQGVVQGRSREVQGSWRGERRGCPPAALYHRFFIPPHSKCTLVTNFQTLISAAKLLTDPGSKICHLSLDTPRLFISSMFHGLYAIFSYTKFCQ